jgi:hypothetical protein
MKKQLFIFLLLSVFCGKNSNNLKAQTPFNPNTYSGWVSTPTNSFATIPAAPGVLSTQISRGSGNTFSTAADGINSSKWNSVSTTAAITANQHLTFSVISNSTTTFEIDSLLLILGRSNTGPDSCILQYKSASTGGSFAPVAAGIRVILPPSSNPTTTLLIIPASPILASASDTVVFRLVAWHASSTLGTMKIINNTTIYGKVIDVVSNSITSPLVQTSNAVCVSSIQGDSVQVTFNSVGVFNTGNTYSLELSDVSGSFSTPLVIGSLNSNLNNGTINGFIPANTASANYRLRIRSSDPVINSLDTTQFLVNPGIIASASLVQPDCPDSTGEITLVITGGTGLLQYNWSNGESTQSLTNLAAGTYTVNITDAVSCSSDSIFSIQSIPNFLVTESILNVVCNSDSSGSIQVSVNGGNTPYSISWSGNGINQTGVVANNLPAGTYIVSISDANNCPYTNTYSVTEPNAITLSAAVIDATCSTCNGSISLSMNGGVAPYSFEWDNQSTSQIISVVPGEYCVEIADANTCQIDTCFTITSTAGITNGINNDAICIFPNPSSNVFQIVFPATLDGIRKELLILNLMGEVIFEEKIDAIIQQLIIPVDKWSNGTYTYQIRTENGNFENGKIQVVH